MKSGSHVVDVRGSVYVLDRLLGQGGQGRVYEAAGGKLAIKLFADRSPALRERLRSQLAQVRRLPLDDVPIARPLEMLSPPALGYVMELVTGMHPMRDLIKVSPTTKDVRAWYRDTGGLRNRLRWLAGAADVLSRLHGKGIAYADPSPENLFYSPSSSLVRLIDADNLRYITSPWGPTVYTPFYGAPEIVRGESGITTLTDVHAFAVIAFEVLTLTHPLIGDWVADGEPELEEQALRGDLPWIDHPEDDRNRAGAGFGLPRELVLSPRLRGLFARTFGPGLQIPGDRPSLGEWCDYLLSAFDNTLVCTRCRSSFYRELTRCPWCDHARPAHVRIRILLWDPGTTDAPRLPEDATVGGTGGKADVLQTLVLPLDETLAIIERFVSGRLNLAGTARLSLSVADGKLVITPEETGDYWLATKAWGDAVKLKETRHVPLGTGLCPWHLHFGPKDRLHRFAVFELIS